MRNFFHEVREFFSVLFGRSEPRFVGFLRKPSVNDDKPSKKPKNRLGFRKIIE